MRTLLAAPLVLALAACHKQPPAKDYTVHGVVVRVDAPSKVIVIDAEKIDGWMDAMTMDYPVHDPKLLDGLSQGDRIKATVHVPDDLNYWIDNISK